MSDKIEILKVGDNGKIRIKCERCKKSKAQEVSPWRGVLTIKCVCGASRKVKVDNRKNKRKKFENSGAIFLDKKRYGVKLMDISLGGVSFESPLEIELSKEVKISFLSDISKRENMDVSLHIRIVSKKDNKYGAQFVDLPDYCQIKKDIYWWIEMGK